MRSKSSTILVQDAPRASDEMSCILPGSQPPTAVPEVPELSPPKDVPFLWRKKKKHAGNVL